MNYFFYFVAAAIVLKSIITRLFPMSSAKPISLNEIQSISKTGEHNGHKLIIIDVRNPSEFSAGHVPNAHNVPVDDLQRALALPKDKFRSEYNFELPTKDDEGVVVYCQRGGRAARAAGYLAAAQYADNLYIYSPGWSEFSANPE
ncbi:thiosulfate sulfurtransferase activity protein [Coemansia spiralis]|uniref:Thiosulfate sulfurtransferase activity protein n=2 Tax=Coemansia TaxID=4863 RepID=A0A9W8G1B7_9FUNG|nr:Rhodanese-like domain-containing protein [Coemansia spiralis]KAJ1987267.1 thiosulfate sulfurtransferase activity protein [Coemansia umbellata]KAJ2619141.1 thiosulfate sulfurtransferase activity protein [Coemansia sp. RSA 1358]KAJ2670062.1 thiosulfate sulfurtransferase activity protein [Coemansia spiralis]